MSTTAEGHATAASAAATGRAVGPAEVAWLGVIPATLAAVVAIVLLGPPLGHALFAPGGSDRLWPPGWWETQGHPEPVKQARYLLAALAPFLLAAGVFASTRRPLRLRSRTIRAITLASHAALLALVAVALLKQRSVISGSLPAPAVFDLRSVLAAAALVLVAVVAMRHRAVAARFVALAGETRTRRVACLAFAACFVAIWLLKGVMTDQLAEDTVGFNLPYTLNDALAVLNGRTPLVDYHVIYAKLLPYLSAIVLGAFGTTVFVYTVFMAVLNGLVLLAVYAVFRLVTRSSLLALALFLPFAAVSDLNCVAITAGNISPMTLSAMWPMRYGGVYLLAWLTARHVGALRPRRAWIVFFVAGLVTLNNLEFGMAAIVATAVALLCAQPPSSLRAASRLVAAAAVGVLGSIAVVSLFTLARAGALPDPALLLEWPRIFTRLGWFSMPLSIWGLHLAIYATFAAAVVLAAVRLSQSHDDVLLTSMLAWSGVFGLLAGSYFVGRPDALKLEAILSAWSFALVLLTVVCVRELSSRGWRRPTLPQLLVLFGLGLSICSLSRLSPPQKQIARLTRPQPNVAYRALAEQFVGERTRRGETVAILTPMSYRIALDLGLRNVAPYGYMNAIVTRSQLQTLIDVARSEHVRKIFTPAPQSFLAQEGDAAPEQLDLLDASGFHTAATQNGIVELSRSDAAAR